MKVRLGLAFFAGAMACTSLATLAQAQETGNRPPPIRILRAPVAPVAATPTAAAAQADAGAINTTQITPPAAINARVLMPNSVTLRNGPDMATIQSLNIIRQLPLADVRAAKVLTLGTSRFNMAPVLNNPRSLFNIAARMRAQPQLTEILADDTRVFEVDKGLIIHSFINYRVKSGSCTDNTRRVMMTRGGISCATYLTPEARAAAFANKRDAHYVADPQKRALAIADAEQKSTIVDAELSKNVAQIRAQLANPVTRGQFDSNGAGEADRLAALDDNALKSEIVNSGDTSIEQTLFVPRIDRVEATFTNKYPIRNKAAGFTPINPALLGGMFVDIAVWSHTWDFPVWFPQLAIQLPPGGADFGCHEGTQCTRSYVYSPKGHSESSDGSGPFDGDMEGWGNGFTNEHLSECADETCRIGIRFIRQGYIYGARHKRDADPTLTSKSPAIISYLAGAEGEARTVINESQARQTAGAANSFGTLWTEWWSKQCADKICLDKIKPIVALEKLEVNAYQKQHPDASTNEAIGTVGKKFAPVFEFEVKASKDRVAAEEAAQAARKAKFGKPAFTPIRIGTPVQRTN